jgi:hypothetical protein
MNKNKKYIIRTIIFTFLLAISSILGSFILVKTHSSHAYQIHYTALLNIKKDIKNENSDILFLGDSSLLMGLDARKFGQLSNKKVYNLALYANAAPISYRILLNEYLKNNSKPQKLVIYFTASAPYSYESNSFEKSYTVLKYGNLRTILRELPIPGIILAGKTILAIYVKRYLGLVQFSYTDFKDKIIKYNGYDINEDKPLPLDFVINSKRNKVLPINYLIDLEKYAQSLDIDTILYVAPTTYNEKGFQYFENKYKNITYNSLRKMRNKHFVDYTHMTKDGAYNNTLKVWNELNKKGFLSN